MRVALVMSDAGSLHLAASALRALDVDVAFTERDGARALALLQGSLVDALVMDITLPGLDALAVMRAAKNMPNAFMPAVVVLRTSPMPAFEKMALNEGAMAVLDKPIDAQQLVKVLTRAGPTERLTRGGASDEEVMELLLRLGFRRTMRGTAYLARCIQLAAKDERLVRQLTTVLYPTVAEEFKTDADRLAHGVRRAIEAAWSSGEIAVQHKLFGNTIDARRGKPTAGEMIARMAQQIRTKEAEG